MTESKTPIRPRDEDFDVESPVRRKSAEELKTKPEHHDQNNWVICAILLSAVLIAAIGILIYNSMKLHQRTVVAVVTSGTMTEDFMYENTESIESTEKLETVIIEEKSKEAAATVEEKDYGADETSEEETESESASESSDESTVNDN